MSKTDSFRTFSKPKLVYEPRHDYEKFTNSQMLRFDSAPKITFDAKECFDKVKEMSQTKALWTEGRKNPIYHFIPIGHRSTCLHQTTTSPARPKAELSSKPKEIFKVAIRKEDCATTKARLAKEDPTVDPYSDEQANVLKDYYKPMGREDFCVLFCFKELVAV